MSDRDDARLRAALTDLGRTAEERVRPAGSAGVPAAGRRRQRAVQAATAALVLVLAGGATATAAQLRSPGAHTGTSPTASAPPGTCPLVYLTVFLDREAAAELRQKLETLLAGPEFGAVELEGPTGGVQAWNVTLLCGDDLEAVKIRLHAVPVLGYTWSDPSSAPPIPPWVNSSASASRR